MRRRFLAIGLVSAVCWLGVGWAQDRFGFMPPGGIDLLERITGTCDACDDLATLSTEDRELDGWRSYLSEQKASIGLSETEVETLSHYVSTIFPTEAPVDTLEALPRDGRTIVIQQCQICHSIATPMLADRDRAAWLRHRNRPPHDSFDLSDAEWHLIASYLAFNAPIDESSIPAELRRGAGGY